MSIHTMLAIEAFRKAERARRNFGKAEAELCKAARLVPPEEKDIYFFTTEIIRLEYDKRDSQANHNQEGIDAAERIIAEFKRKLSDLRSK